MANDRKNLDAKLRETLGSANVYFQPPEGFKLKYPCIVYERNSLDPKFANNGVYNFEFGYTVTAIEKEPDTDLVEKIITSFPKCRHTRRFVNDNLYHDTFTIYY